MTKYIEDRLKKLGKARPEHYGAVNINRWAQKTRMKKGTPSGKRRLQNHSHPKETREQLELKNKLRAAMTTLLEKEDKVSIKDPRLQSLRKKIKPQKGTEPLRHQAHDQLIMRRPGLKKTLEELDITLRWIGEEVNICREALSVTMQIDQRELDRAFGVLLRRGQLQVVNRAYGSMDGDCAWTPRLYRIKAQQK